MFCKLDVCHKSIVTLAISKDYGKIVVRYFVNQAPDFCFRLSQKRTVIDKLYGFLKMLHVTQLVPSVL